MFGFEAMVSTEIDLAFYRVGNFCASENEEILRKDLDLIKEKQDQAYIRRAAYKQRASQYFNKKVKHRSFQVGDQVLKKVNQSTRVPSNGNLGATWEVPYQVTWISQSGTYWLQTTEGRELSHPWHVEHLRKYYK